MKKRSKAQIVNQDKIKQKTMWQYYRGDPLPPIPDEEREKLIQEHLKKKGAKKYPALYADGFKPAN